MVTVKYDPSGRQIWIARYDGGGDDASTAMSLDAAGNVYVTGTSQSAAGEYDLVTIKYTTEGSRQWISRFNTSSNSPYPDPRHVVDRSGNVYVVGHSGTAGGTGSYATIVKYNTNGVQQWIDRYGWPGNAYTWASAIALDSDGNICVAGGTQDSITRDYYTTNDDYLTMKYGQDGIRMWAIRYDGPRREDDRAVAIGTDAFGNVYVSGTSWLSGTDPNWSDWTTVKYSSSGVQLWSRQYNGPDNSGDMVYALAVDAMGNVFVAGRSDGQRSMGDFLIVKYDSEGAQQWFDRYNGPVNDYDEARGIALDPSGNVYVTGSSRSIGKEWYSDDYLTIMYSPSGTRQWIGRYNGTGNEYDDAQAIALDASGNVYVTGSSEAPKGNRDCATIKYNVGGIQQWVARYDGPGSSDERAQAFTIDASGNLYVTGISGAGLSGDYITVKYGFDGVLQWSARYNGPGDFYDWPHTVKVDRSGHVYVTGESDGAGTRRDYATIKYHANGTEQWAARYSAPGNLPDRGSGLEIDRLGNVYVTGSAFYTSSGIDAEFTTIKYDAEGREQWLARGPGTFYGDGAGLALDGFENVYIAGTGRSPTTGRDYVVAKYTPSGGKLWEARYNGPANSSDSFTAMAVDKSGNVYVTGQSWGTDSYYDIATVKYDPKGKELWAARYDGPRRLDGSPLWDFAHGLVVDASGNVYVLSTRLAIIKYDPKGTQEWVRGPGVKNDTNIQASGITVDAAGDVYATGYSYGSNEQIVAKYNSRGEEYWVTAVSGSLDKGIFVDFFGNIYLAGTKAGTGWATLHVVKLRQGAEASPFRDTFSLLQNYPNPFNSTTTVRYVLPRPANVTLKLFDILGREVETLISADHDAGVHEITWGNQKLPSGVYFFRLTGDSFAETKRMVLVR